jgi:uncharacterized membrane protein
VSEHAANRRCSSVDRALAAPARLPPISYKPPRRVRATVIGAIPRRARGGFIDSSRKDRQMLGRLVTVAAVACGGVMLARNMKGRSPGGRLSEVEVSTEVDVPVRTAYDQWTQFEEFPRFMDSVQEVRQLDDTHLRWRATVAGKPKQWDAEITDQIPDQRIAWRSTSGPMNLGVVTFDKVREDCTRIVLRMVYGPESLDEKIGDALGAMKLEAQRNLQNFRQLIESRGSEIGAWRGTIEGSTVQH